MCCFPGAAFQHKKGRPGLRLRCYITHNSSLTRRMECSLQENSSSNPRKAIEELVQGREFARQLRGLLCKSPGDDGSAPAEDLVLKILNSFSNTISILNSASCSGVSDVKPIIKPGSPCWNAPKSESSEESSRSISTMKDRRGCYKRRRTSQTCSKETSALVDDGHAWRKYGQKAILNAKFPRHYFRCTHKYDQGCQAAKQVQKIQDDPPVYRTTYIGQHTCRPFPKVPELILASSPGDSPFILSFENSLTSKQNHPFLSSFQPVKEEHKEEIPSDDMVHNQSSSSDYLEAPDQTAFGSPCHMTTLSSPMESDDCDSISGFFLDTFNFTDEEVGLEF